MLNNYFIAMKIKGSYEIFPIVCVIRIAHCMMKQGNIRQRFHISVVLHRNLVIKKGYQRPL